MNSRVKLAAAGLFAAGMAFLAFSLFTSPGRVPREIEGSPARVVVGTFNVENFDLRDIRSRTGYTEEDAANVAMSILKSGAGVLALQEIEGDATMRTFTERFLPGWKFCGVDTDGTQDLYFLWNPRVVSYEESLPLLISRIFFWISRPFPLAYFGNRSYTWKGVQSRLFDRLPVLGDFRLRSSGKRFSLVNVHLKSQLVTGGGDLVESARRNTARRSAQIAAIESLCARVDDRPLLILGDFNADFSSPGDSPDGTKRPLFPLLWLKEGTSYDKEGLRANLDYIGYAGLPETRIGAVRETETRIERRSQPDADHPDHDIITVEVELP